MLLLLACVSTPDTAADSAPAATVPVPWSVERAPLSGTSPAGRAWRRAIIHLHSTLSHDACDGHEGERTDAECEDSLRAALCADTVDYAFLTDHPAYAGEHPYEDLLDLGEGDEVVDGIAARRTCDSGHQVMVLPGIEDELMPIGLDAHVGATAEENDALYNDTGAATFDAVAAVGGLTMQAHTEGKTFDELQTRQALGLTGTEMFNLHAMVDPTKREENLGLDPFGYLDAIGPFITLETEAQPDLAFLAFYEAQTVSIDAWDALNQTSFLTGTAGTDAHENALPMAMADGERVDSYRRMIRWFSNILLVDADTPAAAQDAVAQGHLFVAFEILGTPAGFDVTYQGDTTLEMGGSAAAGGTLSVGCATLAADTPQDGDPPEITTTVLKDGAPFAEGCGDHTLTEPGVYRVRVDIVPNHLAGFLDDQTALIRSYPWLYSNALRIGL